MNDLMTKSFTSYVDIKKEAIMKDLEAQHDNVELTAAEQQLDQDMNLCLCLAEADKVKTDQDEGDSNKLAPRSERREQISSQAGRFKSR
ncbi:unnamed protein product [Rhodiola kirilowii]